MGGCKSLSLYTNRSPLSLYLEFFYCYVRYGCLPRQFFNGEFWNKTSNDRHDIMTYRSFCKIMNRLNKPQDVHLLENKARFNQLFADFCHREWLLSSESSYAEIEEFICRHNQVIIKPFDQMEGHGIYKLELDSIKDMTLSVKQLKASPVMIEEILKQHPKMVFGNTSVNTVRVNTLLDNNCKAHIVSCVLRAGVGDSVVDNYCSGGAIYPVDVESGVVTGKGKSRCGDAHIVHPGTNIMMLGYQVPNWQTLKKEIVIAAERIPTLRLVGWDVALTDNGIALIEGNHNPDYEFFEFIGEGKSLPIIKMYIQ